MIRFSAVRSAFRRGHVNVTCHACRGYVATCTPGRQAEVEAAHIAANHQGADR